MNIISEERLGIHLYEMGLRNKDLVDALAVAEMESGFDEEAWNYDTVSGDDSYGIFQINFYEGLGPERERRLGLDREELKDFENNLRGFAMLFKSRGYTFKDWSTHPSSKNFDPNKRREWNDAVRKAKNTLNFLAADGLIGSEGDEDWRIADDDHELFSYVINPEIARVQKILNDRYGHNFDLDGDTGSGPDLDVWAEAVRPLQADLGVDADGDWRIKSQEAFDAKYRPQGTGGIKDRLGTQAIVYDDQGNIVSGGPEVMVGETVGFEGPPTDAPFVVEEEEIEVQDPNISGQAGNPAQDLEQEIEAKTSKLDILMWEYLRGNPSVLVEHPITGEMVDLVELIEENPLGLEDGTPEMEQWIKSIYYQTDHYQDSEVGRSDREYKWNSGGDTEDEWSTRRLDLISHQVEQLEQILGQANINLDDNQIWELAKQSYLQGLNLAEIKDFLVTATTDEGSPLFNFGEGAPAGGTISAFRTSIKDIYRRYLMEPDEEVLARRSQQLFSGETTIDLVEDEMIEQAALLFPAWATRIEAGKSPLEIVGAYNGIFNSVLGYSPQWDGRNRDMAVTLGGLVVEGEEPGTAMSGGDFARWLRTTDEYDQSPRGINDAYQLVTGLGRAMGAVA